MTISITEWAAVVSAGAAATVPLGGLVGILFRLSAIARQKFHDAVMARLTSQDKKIEEFIKETREDHQTVRADVEKIERKLNEEFVRRTEMAAYTAVVGEMHNDVRELRTYIIGRASYSRKGIEESGY